LASRILTQFKQQISGLELVPTGGGAFEIELDGKLVYSKLKEGEFPDEAAIEEIVGEQLKTA